MPLLLILIFDIHHNYGRGYGVEVEWWSGGGEVEWRWRGGVVEWWWRGGVVASVGISKLSNGEYD